MLQINYNHSSISIFKDENCIYKGSKKFNFSKLSHWIVYNQENIKVFEIRIRGIFSSFKCKLIVSFPEEQKELILQYTLWKGPRIEFSYEENIYLLVFNSGNKFAIFRNDQQVGLLESDSLTVKKYRVFRLLHNQDLGSLILAIISVAILFLKGDEINQESDFTIDFGYLGSQYKEFDPDWEPAKL